MKKIVEELQQHKGTAQAIIDKIEQGKDYRINIRTYLPILNQLISQIFEVIQQPENSDLQININFIIQVLKDIVYGIEQEDTVFLLDVLKYGLLQIYDYMIEMLTEVAHE